MPNFIITHIWQWNCYGLWEMDSETVLTAPKFTSWICFYRNAGWGWTGGNSNNYGINRYLALHFAGITLRNISSSEKNLKERSECYKTKHIYWNDPSITTFRIKNNMFRLPASHQVTHSIPICATCQDMYRAEFSKRKWYFVFTWRINNIQGVSRL